MSQKPFRSFLEVGRIWALVELERIFPNLKNQIRHHSVKMRQFIFSLFGLFFSLKDIATSLRTNGKNVIFYPQVGKMALELYEYT